MTTQTEPPLLTAASASDFISSDIIEQPYREKITAAETKYTLEEYGQDTPGWPWDL